MKVKVFLTFAAAIACTAGIVGSAFAGDTLQKIKDSGVINIGGRDASFPFSYKVGGSDPIGFSADLCAKVVTAVKQKLSMPDLKVQYTIVTPVNRQALMENGTIDLECSTTTNTLARQKQVAFSPNIFVASISAAVKKDSGIKSFEDLNGKNVAAVSGSTSIQLLREYKGKNKIEFRDIYGKDIADTFLLLNTGRADAYVLEDIQLAGQIATSRTPKEFTIIKQALRSEPYGIMYRKDDPKFKELVDGTITGIFKSGEINEIYAKWFTKPVPPLNVNMNFEMSDENKENYKNPNSNGV